uniref:Uncharacterized protein n=1 Tax=viral metagenome TaxID=1070528 RepID=A0A6H2A0Z1_9ZZZZ
MKCTIHQIERVDFEQFCEEHELELDLEEKPDGKWRAELVGVTCMNTQYGNPASGYGQTPFDAICDLAEKASGFRLLADDGRRAVAARFLKVDPEIIGRIAGELL